MLCDKKEKLSVGENFGKEQNLGFGCNLGFSSEIELSVAPRGVGTLAENSGWAARLVLAEALGLVLAQAQELARCGGWGGVA